MLTLEGPQTSLCIIAKGLEVLSGCEGKIAQWCFASSQISQWNEDGSLLINNFGNRCFKYWKLGCLKPKIP